MIAARRNRPSPPSQRNMPPALWLPHHRLLKHRRASRRSTQTVTHARYAVTLRTHSRTDPTADVVAASRVARYVSAYARKRSAQRVRKMRARWRGVQRRRRRGVIVVRGAAAIGCEMAAACAAGSAAAWRRRGAEGENAIFLARPAHRQAGR